MDLSNELRIINQKSSSIDLFIDDWVNEKEELNRKIYILKMIKIKNAIMDFLSDLDVKTISFIQLSYNQSSFNYQFSLGLIDNHNKTIINQNKTKEKYKKLKDVFENNGKLNIEYTDFLQQRSIKIDLSDNVEDKIFEFLLNDELRNILIYSKMSAKLPSKESQNSRTKI